ncbi:MAG: hypothetical protein R3C24_03845 [Cyanobacteriota/Melainabacteria group bacterium]
MVLPESPPAGLSPRSYCKLALQYHLMGNVRQSIKAGRLALAGDKEDFDGTPLENISESDLSLLRKILDNLDEGVSFSADFMGGARRLLLDLGFRIQETNERADQWLAPHQFFRILKFGVEESARLLGEKAGATFSTLVHSVIVATQPSRDVPSGLKAGDYLVLGKRYLALFWPEQARDALEHVLELVPSGPEREQAEKLLLTKVPLHPVPYLAVKRFINARRLASLGRGREAREAYRLLVEDYPEFEWALEQYAIQRIQDGEVEEALDLLDRILASNEGYVSAYLHKARAHAIKGEVFESQTALDRATRLDPGWEEISVLRQTVAMMARL